MLVTILVTTLLHPNKELSTLLSKLDVNGKPNLMIFSLNSKKRLVTWFEVTGLYKLYEDGPNVLEIG